jgi:hypothetical protein
LIEKTPEYIKDIEKRVNKFNKAFVWAWH